MVPEWKVYQIYLTEPMGIIHSLQPGIFIPRLRHKYTTQRT